MRLLHTSDWHLGHRLHGVSRDREHAHFLRWLVDCCCEQAIDVLIVAGDIFDTANPAADAQRAYFELLASCLQKRPQMEIVIIGGNHDSPARLDAVAEVLRPLRIHVVGALPRDRSGAVDLKRALIPLGRPARGGKSREVTAWLVAIPYLRPTDWPVVPSSPAADASGELPSSDSATVRELVSGLRQLYDQLFTAARAQRQPGQALLAVGHCLLAGGEVSMESERRIQLGNSLPLPGDLFPDDVAYVALGHLHKAQQVATAGHLRYSGSPIPLSFAERHYTHQVVLVELAGAELQRATPIPVPRWRPILSIPDAGPGLPLTELLPQLRALPRTASDEDSEDPLSDETSEPPLLEVRVRLLPGESQPLLRAQLEEALVGAPHRLLRIACERSAGSDDSPLRTSETPLSDLKPEEVFTRLYQQRAADPAATVPVRQLQLFRRLLEQIDSGDDEGAAVISGGEQP